jgi:hypothetical protein
MTHAELAFFRRFLGGYFESAYLNGQIDWRTCRHGQSWLDTSEAGEYASKLFSDGAVIIPEQYLNLQLRSLREMNGKEFNHIEIVRLSQKGRRRRKCFVGHRFIPAVNKTLRWNLRQVLEPYGVELDWSGRDPRSVQVFEDIVKRVNEADFCIFDNRETRAKPNVYIEVGMCIALSKPFILFEFESRSHRHSSSPIPSDLTSALTLRYRNYQQLFQDFYFRLPVFFENNLS